MTKRLLPSLLVSVVLVSPLSAATTTELIPQNALGALFFPSFDSMANRKGDTLAQQGGALLRLFLWSQFIDVKHVDWKEPVGVVFLEGEDKDKGAILNIVTLNKREDITTAFTFREGKPNPKKIATVEPEKSPVVDRKLRYLIARDRTVFLSDSKKALERYLSSKPIADFLRKAEKTFYDKEDLVFFVNFENWKTERKQLLDDIRAGLKPKGKKEERVADELMHVLACLRYGFVSASARMGLRVTAQPVFRDDKKRSVKKFLDNLRGNETTSNLVGLPKGNLLFAQAASGDGSKTAIVSKLLFGYFTQGTLVDHFVATPDRPNVLAVYQELWKRMRGERLGVYFTSDPRQFGVFGATAILDVEDSKTFLADIRQLAKLGDSSKLKLGPKGEDVALIRKLVGQLGDDDFEVREGASNRLRLVGPKVIPYLEPALRSKDPEVVHRARELVSEIENAVAQQRQDVKTGKFANRLRPSFTYFPNAEKRAGQSIDIIQVVPAGGALETKAQLAGLFGPEWDKIRLAKVGKRVVVLFGSEVELLDKTLANLQNKKPGLAETKEVTTAVSKVGEPNHLEIHVATQKAYNLYMRTKRNPRPIANPGSALSSFTMKIRDDRLEWSLWVPTEDLWSFRSLFQ